MNINLIDLHYQDGCNIGFYPDKQASPYFRLIMDFMFYCSIFSLKFLKNPYQDE